MHGQPHIRYHNIFHICRTMDLSGHKKYTNPHSKIILLPKISPWRAPFPSEHRLDVAISHEAVTFTN